VRTADRPTPGLHRLTVAPPRISVAREPAPPVPDVARAASTTSASTPSSTSGGTTVRPSSGSLVDATAHLFAPASTDGGPAARAGTGSPVLRRSPSPGGDAMSLTPAPPPPPPPSLPSSASTSLAAPGGAGPAPYAWSDPDLADVAGPADPMPPVAAFDALVDAVVQRIERRVVDELERRGRYGRGR
jgi:hypothetical protein